MTTPVRGLISTIAVEGPRSSYRLVFPEYDVKNGIRPEFHLDSQVADLIDE
jgi:hypothetical protein